MVPPVNTGAFVLCEHTLYSRLGLCRAYRGLYHFFAGLGHIGLCSLLKLYWGLYHHPSSLLLS